MATDPSQSLYDKARAYQVRKAQDWGRFAASVPVAVSASLQGQDPVAAANRLYPHPQPGPSKLDVAAQKQKVLDAWSKSAEGRRKERGDLIGKMKSDNDLIKAVLQAAASEGGAAQAAYASTANNVRDQQTAIAKATADNLQKFADQASGGNVDSVRAVFRGLQKMITPNGDQSPDFATQLTQSLVGMTPGEKSSLFAYLDAEMIRNDQPGGIASVLGDLVDRGGPEAQQALQALQMYRANGQQIESIVKDGMDASNAILADTMDHLTKGGALGSQRMIDTVKGLMDALGEQDPDKQMDMVDKALNLMDPANDPKGGPDAQRYADLLDSMDSEAAPANLQEAKQRLLNDPEFLSWMQQNGFTDRGVAFRELKRLTRANAHATKQHDLAMLRDRNRGQTGPSPEQSPSAKAVASTAGAAPSAPSGQTTFYRNAVTGEIMEWTPDGGLAPADPDQLDALLSEHPDRAGELIVTKTPSEITALADLAPKTGTPAVAGPELAPEEKKVPSPAMVRNEAAYRMGQAIARPSEAMNELGSAVRAMLQRRKEKRALNQADDALEMTQETP